VALLASGRNDDQGTKCYLLDYEQPVNKALRTYPVANLRKNLLSCLDAYFVVSKKTPNARTVLDRLESTCKELKNRGKVE